MNVASNLLSLPADPTAAIATEKARTDDSSVVLLRNVPWSLYVQLRDLKANQALRMIYDRGTLILMSPSPFHERVASLIGRLIEIWTEERDIPIAACGSTTFRCHDLDRGLEPDKCYYVQSEPDVRGLLVFPSPPPPPDLAVEIDVTSLSDRKLAIYGELGVGEVWLWQDEELQCLRWDGRRYVAQEHSTVLPGFPLQLVRELNQTQFIDGLTATVKRFRALIRRNPPGDSHP